MPMFESQFCVFRKKNSQDGLRVLLNALAAHFGYRARWRQHISNNNIYLTTKTEAAAATMKNSNNDTNNNSY